MPNYEAEARKAARKYGVNPSIFVAQIRAESGFNPNARSPAGAQGIAQFMPATARSYGVRLGDGRASDDLDGAARYMRDNLRRTGGNYTQALSIYNSGKPDGYKSIAETRNYVQKILGSARGGGGGDNTADNTTQNTTQGAAAPDTGASRQQLLLGYLSQRGDPNALLTLASGLKQLGTPDSAPSPAAVPSSAPRGAPGGTLKQTGTAKFEGKTVAAWIAPILAYARKHGWAGRVNSGYRSYADQTRIYNSGVRPAAKPGTSNHEGADYPRGAVDVSDAPQLAEILQRSPYRGRLSWAGGKDPVHFSHPHNGSY